MADENLYQAWERFKELLMKCPQHYLMEMQEITPSRVRSTKTSDGLAAIQAQLNNLGREIKKVNEKVYAAQVGCGDIEHQLQDFYQWNNANLVSRTLKDAYFTCNLVDLFKEEDIEQHLQGKLGYGRVLLVLNKIIRPFLGRLNELNNLNEPFELRRNQEDDLIPSIEEGEVIEEFRARDDELDIGIDDYPILEDMDAYRDDGMGDVIFGEPFLREVGIKTKQFEGIITLYKSDDEVSEKDKKNGISHAYKKLKGFYKGVLNLGPDYIRNAKMEEWLTRGHISVHEME
ncbi:hypothetical protein Tco_0122363 [Tanacetum coccineum]